MSKILKHLHLIVRAEIENPPIIESLMTKWMQELVRDIGMKILSGPHTIYSNDIGNRGMTSIVVLNTSHSAVHVWDECSPGLMQVDVYTCGELDPQIVLNKMNQFKVIKYEAEFYDRETGITKLPLTLN